VSANGEVHEVLRARAFCGRARRDANGARPIVGQDCDVRQLAAFVMRPSPSSGPLFSLCALTIASSSALLVACGGSAGLSVSEHPDASPAQTVDAAKPAEDSAPSPAPDAEADAGGPLGPDPTDGTPSRSACTSTFGMGLTAVHGRLDGYLVAVVQPYTNRSCNSDSHVHLQVSAGGAIYDVATNLQTLYAEHDLPLPGAAWAEGWHPGEPLNYPTIGLHSAMFTQPTNEAALAAIVTADLTNANHVSIYATGYGPDGVHDVHRKSGNDGAIIIDPLSPTAHGLFFRFTTDSF
jgi:hypothetical protein